MGILPQGQCPLLSGLVSGHPMGGQHRFEALQTSGKKCMPVCLTPALGPQILVSCSKGISNDTLQTVNEILESVVPPALAKRLAYLSGPSFAVEVAREQPSAVTIASKYDDIAARAQALLSTPRFRCYRTQDITGDGSPLFTHQSWAKRQQHFLGNWLASSEKCKAALHQTLAVTSAVAIANCAPYRHWQRRMQGRVHHEDRAPFFLQNALGQSFSCLQASS